MFAYYCQYVMEDEFGRAAREQGYAVAETLQEAYEEAAPTDDHTHRVSESFREFEDTKTAWEFIERKLMNSAWYH